MDPSVLHSVCLFLLLLFLLGSSEGWIRRKQTKLPKHGDLKLVDGGTESEGTVLIYNRYDWGPICDDDWDIREAHVVCRQLGMGDGRDAYRRNRFNSYGLGNMFLDDVHCNGSESRLIDCAHKPWGEHDCHNTDELAAVRCYTLPTPRLVYPSWNPLGVLSVSKPQAIFMLKQKFNVSFEPADNATFGSYVVGTVGGQRGAMCADDFTVIEASVVCRELGQGFGKDVFAIDFGDVPRRHVLRAGLCRGNESSLSECTVYASRRGVPCESEKAVAITCTTVLPDLVADILTVESSAYLVTHPLWVLTCAMEERCVSESALSMVNRLSVHQWQYTERRLLRFSSIIGNEGTADFLPSDPMDSWQWHACHLHYHSMQMFAKYEVLDPDKNVIASGHKASFCLEDNECKDPRSFKYRCSSTRNNYGTQGISPGCKDIYLHNYDCQWIDVTDLRQGTFEFRLIINPELRVAELDFFRNAIVCELWHYPTGGGLRNCHYAHPHDL